MSGVFDFDDDATPLTPEECEGLTPTHITRRRELNELEQKNIAEADRWAFTRKRDVFDEATLVTQLGAERFTWGSASLQAPGDAHRAYIDALRRGDEHDLGHGLAQPVLIDIADQGSCPLQARA